LANSVINTPHRVHARKFELTEGRQTIRRVFVLQRGAGAGPGEKRGKGGKSKKFKGHDVRLTSILQNVDR